MNKFTSIDELRSAKRRLYFRKEELEAEMKENLSSMKNAFTPSAIISKMTGSASKNGAAKTAPTPGVMDGVATTLIDFLVNDLFMRRSSYFKRFFLSYIIRLVGPSLIHNAGPAVTNLIKKAGLMKYFSKQTSEKHEAYPESGYY